MLEYGMGRRGKDFCCPVGSRMLENFFSTSEVMLHLTVTVTEVRGEAVSSPHILFNFTIDLAAFTDFTASTVSNVKTFDQEASPFENEI